MRNIFTKLNVVTFSQSKSFSTKLFQNLQIQNLFFFWNLNFWFDLLRIWPRVHISLANQKNYCTVIFQILRLIKKLYHNMLIILYTKLFQSFIFLWIPENLSKELIVKFFSNSYAFNSNIFLLEIFQINDVVFQLTKLLFFAYLHFTDVDAVVGCTRCCHIYS